jgi:membrane-associated phospholipid phosphatase
MNRFALPLFLTSRNKYFFSVLWVIIGASLYLASNHFPIYPPQMLPMTHWDLSIPFIPWTVWIYGSEIPFFFAVYLVSKDLVNANKYLYSFLALQIMSVTIFWLWPTTYPRELFPLPAGVDPFTRDYFLNFRNLDTPANCLPSMHVSSCYLSSFLYLDEQKKKFPFFFGWATAIALSTLTTKQHYIIDVVGGIAVATVLYVIFHRLVPYRAMKAARLARVSPLPGETVINLFEARNGKN